MKKGFVGKLEHDFDTSKNLEVYLPNLDNWYRVTSRDFRSFNGLRRIEGESYDGPVYLYATNNKIPFTNTGKVAGYKYEPKPGKHRT